MKYDKSHFRFSKGQRNGIIFLILFIVILQLIYFFVDFTPSKTWNKGSDEIENYQHKIDSLKRISNDSTPKIYPFNPNYLTDYKAYRIGLSTDEIDRLFEYRKSGKFVNSAK